MVELAIVKYCAEECERQHSGELSVYDMVNAWEFADYYRTGHTNYWDKSDGPPSDAFLKIEELTKIAKIDGNNHVQLTLDFIEHLGTLVEPVDNKNGFRKIPIYVGNENFGYVQKAPWDRITFLLQNLIDAYYEDGAEAFWYHDEVSDPSMMDKAEDRFYYEYENIHPFRDGNGRSGKILYNYLCGTLDNPIMPPNFWESNNP